MNSSIINACSVPIRIMIDNKHDIVLPPKYEYHAPSVCNISFSEKRNIVVIRSEDASFNGCMYRKCVKHYQSGISSFLINNSILEIIG